MSLSVLPIFSSTSFTDSGPSQPPVAATIAQPRGATPRPRSGAEAGRTPCPKGGGEKNAKKVLESFFFFLSTFYYFKPGEQFHKTCEKSKEVFNAEGPGPGARA